MIDDVELIRRRFGDDRPGLQLIGIEEAAIPVTIVQADVLAQERKPLPILEEFVVRLVAAGIGATDEIGLRAAVEPHPAKDLHATILHALGLHHEDLFFEHNGRPERLTGVAGSARPIAGVFR